MNLDQAAERFPNKPALIFSNGETVSYAQLNRRSNRIAHYFREIGLKRGDCIAFLMRNQPEFLDIACAAGRTGLYFSPLPSGSSASETQHILKDSGAKLFIVSQEFGDLADTLDDEFAGDVKILVLGDATGTISSLDDVISAKSDTPIDDQSYGRDLLYSSGTTGRPKGIKKPLPSGAFDAEEDGKSLASLMTTDNEIIYLVPAPLYHAAALHAVIEILSAAGTAVIMKRFDAVLALKLIEKYRVTHSQWVPTMFARMLELDEETRAGFDLSSHKEAGHGAAPCPTDVKRAMIEWWGPIIVEYYGGTEGIGACLINSEEWLERPGSVGKAVSGEIHVLGEDDKELPAGETGRVFFSGGASFEYLNQSDENSVSAERNDQKTYGDIGYVDEEGYLFLTDRSSDLIIAGGVNIYPREIEQALLSHPDVRDVAVFGVPHKNFGESVKAVIELRNGAKENDTLKKKLLEYIKPVLATHKLPRSIDFIDALPRGENGKLYKRRLRDKYWQETGRNI